MDCPRRGCDGGQTNRQTTDDFPRARLAVKLNQQTTRTVNTTAAIRADEGREGLEPKKWKRPSRQPLTPRVSTFAL